MKKKANPCKGCIWQVRIDERKIYCPFWKCVKDRIPSEKEGARHGQRSRDD